MTVGIGIVGTGLMGGIYADVLATGVPGARLVAATGGRRAAQFAAQRGVAHRLTLDELLAAPDVDAVIIATPHSVHVDQVVAAAAAGCHVLLEKPMALNVDECWQMVQACEDAEVVLTVGHITRWMDAARFARDLIDDGDVGDVRIVQAWRALSGGLPYGADSWAQRASEGGPWLDWGSHGRDILRWYAGADVVVAFGQGANPGADTGMPSTIVAQFRFANGVLGQVMMTHDLPHSALGSRARYVVVGSRAMLEISAYGLVKRSREDGGWDEVYRSSDFDGPEAAWGYPSGYLMDAFRRQVADLVGAVAHGLPLGVTAMDGLRAVEMVDAVQRSAVSGQAVQLPLRTPTH